MTDGWDDSLHPELVPGISRNVLVNNGGSGVRLVWDERNHASDLGYGYIAAALGGNLIADNAGFALEISGWGVNSAGYVNCTNNTFIYNEAGGLGYLNLAIGEYPDPEFGGITAHRNDIMYFNNGGEEQVIGLTGAQVLLVESTVFYSDWQNITSCATTCTQNNIDVDPDFDKLGRLYHLDVESPCIDVGDNNSANDLVDIDNESRIQDGDFDCIGEPDPVVDMGCDEATEPDC
jgi:hypothetical protein